MFPPHLRTTANYSHLHPQALACQTRLPNQNNNHHESYNYNSSSSSSSSSLAAILTASNGIILFPTHAPYEPSLILTHHDSASSNVNSTPTNINTSASTDLYNQNKNHYDSSSSYLYNNYLSFSTQKSQFKLASVQHYSNHVLIWDTTGESLQPLLAKLPCNNHNYNSTSFLALDWNKHHDTIHTSRHDTISTWDLRMSNHSCHRPCSTIISGTSSSSFQSNYSTNINTTSNNNGNGTIISISSSYNQEHELACIDIHGVVYIYDDRMNYHNRSSKNNSGINNTLEICSFLAHSGGGIGIESILLDDLTTDSCSTKIIESGNDADDKAFISDNNQKTHGNGCGYVTWGLERVTNTNSNDTDANKHSSPNYHHNHPSRRHSNESGLSHVNTNITYGNSVKVWKQMKDGIAENDKESYWFMPDTGINTTNKNKYEKNYSCCSDISIDNLSSVRICPKPFQGGIITVSTPSQTYEASTPRKKTQSSDSNYNWQIDLWRLSCSNTSDSQELENIACFHNTDDDKFTNVIGQSYLNNGRYLIASELTLGPSLDSNLGYSTTSSALDGGGVGGGGEKDVELTICCLDNAGYITTYAIPEASTSLHETKSKATRLRNKQEHHHQFYFQQHRSENNNSNNNFSAMVHHSSSDPDLASRDVVTKRGRGQSDADLYYNEVHDSGAEITVDHHHAFEKNSIEGGFMKMRKNVDHDLFYEKDEDLDDGGGGISQQQLNIQVHKNRGVDSSQDLDMLHKDEAGERELSNKVDPLKAMRVPCPRLCGAAFGVGGGLISFHNGEVKKMWHWFSSSGSPKSKTNLTHEIKKIHSVDSLDAIQYFQKNENRDTPSSVSEVESKKEHIGLFPRTLLGLMNMNEAAKFAQWGDENDDNDDDLGGSSLSIDEADSSDDDLSLSSSSSDDSLDMNEDLLDPINSVDKMRENYFGKNAAKFGLPQYLSPAYERKIRINTRSRSESFLGPTTETLVPTVFFTTKYDDIILSGQSAELADMFLLGPWTREFLYDEVQSSCVEDEWEFKEALSELNKFEIISY